MKLVSNSAHLLIKLPAMDLNNRAGMCTDMTIQKFSATKSDQKKRSTTHSIKIQGIYPPLVLKGLTSYICLDGTQMLQK